MRIALVLVALVLTGCAETATGVPPAEPSVSRTPTSPTPADPAMPNVVGMRLSEAKEMLSAQGYPSVEEDSTGQARQILEPLNWVVEAQLPEADAPAPRGTQVVLKVRKPTDGAGDTTASPGTVPNVLCKDLQSAQDTLQAADFYNLGAVKFGEPTGTAGCKS